MKRSALLVALFTAVITLVLPFVGGSGPSLVSPTPAFAEAPAGPLFASGSTAEIATVSLERGESQTPLTEAQAKVALTTDSEHLAQKPVPKPKPKPKPIISQADAASGTAARRAAAQSAGFSCP